MKARLQKLFLSVFPINQLRCSTLFRVVKTTPDVTLRTQFLNFPENLHKDLKTSLLRRQCVDIKLHPNSSKILSLRKRSSKTNM